MSDVTTVPTGERIRAVVAGLSAGDAITWTSWWHRMSQLPPRRGVRLGQAWQHARDQATTSLPTPYLQSSSPALVDPAGPTDDVEWFVVAALHHLGRRLDGSAADLPYAIWHELAAARAADEREVVGRIGTVIALDGLRALTEPPASGNDNPHYFDDIACVRAVAAGLFRPGSPREAADVAEHDAAVTHALDGVWGARGTAALVSSLVGGADRATAVRAALHELPAESWCAHVAAECLDAVEPNDSPLTLAARLERDVVDHVYAYATQAPETLGLLLAHLSVADSGEALLLGALAHPRHADALVPLAGALAGAAWGWAPEHELPELRGTCVRALAGMPLSSVVGDLQAAAGQGAVR
jgi:ADP-ribosylglycohydrolase